MRKAVITIIDTGYDYSREIGILRDLNFDTSYQPLEGTSDADVIINAAKDCEVALIGPELWSREVFKRIPKLKMLARLGAGTERIDILAATDYGVAVTNTPGANACSVAQHALAFMLELALGIAKYDRNMRAGQYTRDQAQDVFGKTIGLMGFGNVSKTLAKLLCGFDTEILAYDLYKDEEVAKELGVRFVGMKQLIRESDFLSLHMPLNENTKGLVDMAFIKQMKPTAFLINTSRGGVVNELDLIKAIKQGVIAGAGLDVYDMPELSVDNPLMHMENIIHTPYIAYSSELARTRTLDMAINSIENFCIGKDIPNLLNPRYVNNQ